MSSSAPPCQPAVLNADNALRCGPRPACTLLTGTVRITMPACPRSSSTAAASATPHRPRYLASEQDIRKEHPEAELVSGSREERDVGHGEFPGGLSAEHVQRGPGSS